MTKTLPDEVQAIMPAIQEIAEGAGLELVDIEYRRRRAGQLLTVIADCAGGITLGQCAVLNRLIAGHLETLKSPKPGDFWSGACAIEVNSPGLDRPLRTQRDFQRSTGRRIRVQYRDAQNIVRQMTGVVETAAQESMVIKADGGDSQTLQLNQVVKAVAEIDFGRRI